MEQNNTEQVRVRFAPSPTGFVHIGNFRTALFSFLFAKHNHGKFILRIEDTDRTRLVEGAVEHLLRVLKKMGIQPDEGFFIGSDERVHEIGEYGPYLQSERLQLYQKHALELVEKGKAYYCYCSEQRLEELRAEQVALKKPPMYDRHCRNLSAEEKEAQIAKVRAEKRNPVIRQAIPESGHTVVHDLIYGDVSYQNQVLDDQVLLKSDGFPTYHLAVVVDDHFMKITHITRTEEWIPSAPKHVLLYEAFGWTPPAYAHLPLVLNSDKSKLSKRQGDVAVEDFLKKGYLPEALINFVAFLGWNPKTEQEIFSLEELIEQFDLKKVNKAGAIFDTNKLDWINGLYIRKMPLAQLVKLVLPFWEEGGYVTLENGKMLTKHLNKEVTQQYLEQIIGLEKDRLKKLSEIGERSGYFFKEPLYDDELLVWKDFGKDDAKQKLTELLEVFVKLSENSFELSSLEQNIKNFVAEKAYQNGPVLWPLRVALTGMQKSPGPFEVAAVLASGLGKEEVIQRIKKAISKL